MSALRVETVVSTQALFGLRDEWEALWERCPWATPFQSAEWLLPWWTHLGRGTLHTLALWNGTRLVGLLPAFTASYFRLPLRRIGLMGMGHTDYLDLLLDPDLRTKGATLLLAQLTDAANGTTFVDLQQLRAESPLLACAIPPGHHEVTLAQEVTPELPLPSTVEQFRSGLSKRLRSNLRYYRGRLEREGYLFSTADAETLPAYMEALFELHQSRWRRRRLPGVFAAERVRNFHREAARGFMKRDWLRLHVLELRGTPRAALHVFTCRDRGYYYSGGFDPSLARLSPGTALTGFAIEDALFRGANAFDFLRGDEPYKYAWGATNRVNQRRLIWREGSAGALAPRLAAVEQRIEHTAKQVARRLQEGR